MTGNITVSAHYLRNSLDLAKIEQKNADLPLFPLVRKERHVLVYQPSEKQYVCVYSFGVVTLCGIEDKKEIGKLLKRFAYGEEIEDAKAARALPEEDYAIVIDPDQPETAEFDYVRLKQLTLEKLLLVFHMLAQSVAIDFIESRVHETMRAIERINDNLEKRGTLATDTKSILKTVGMSGHMVHFMVDRLSLLDKPDITWEDKEAELLFVNLRRMFELDDRFSTLRFKLEFIKDSSETMLNAISARKAEFLEWIIILLFIAEIAFALVGIM